MSLYGLRHTHLDHFIGIAVMLLFLELIIHLLFSMLDSASIAVQLPTRKAVYYFPFVLFVSIFLVVFFINLTGGLVAVARELGRNLFHRD